MRWSAWVVAIVLLSAVLIYYRKTGTSGVPRSLSNMKQLAIACQLYAENNGERWPYFNWNEALAPYAKQQELFDTPEARTRGGHWGLALHLRVAGKHLSPKRDALLFEVDSYAPNVIANLAARATDHYAGKGSPVAFTDLSVRFIKKGEVVSGK